MVQDKDELRRRWQDGLPHGKGIWEAFSYSDVQLLLPSLQLDAFATFVTVPDFTGWMLRPRLALKAPCSMTSYCGFLQPATHPLPCWTSHPFPHPQGFGCALMQLLLPWSKQVLCVFASKPSSVQEHHLVCEGKGFLLPSFHLQCAFLSTAL